MNDAIRARNRRKLVLYKASNLMTTIADLSKIRDALARGIPKLPSDKPSTKELQNKIFSFAREEYQKYIDYLMEEVLLLLAQAEGGKE